MTEIKNEKTLGASFPEKPEKARESKIKEELSLTDPERECELPENALDAVSGGANEQGAQGASPRSHMSDPADPDKNGEGTRRVV